MTRNIAPLLLSLPLFIACGDKDIDDTGGDVIDVILALDGDASSGEALFAGSCSGCHGADGDSGTAPMLSVQSVLLSDEELVCVMINGSGNMPPVSLEDQEAADILAFLRVSF